MPLTCPSVLSRAPIAAALCMASCVIGQASAQTSLTIYGRVDVSLQMQNRSLTDDSSYTIVHTGGIRPSSGACAGSRTWAAV
jgi:hypothetical protein